MLQVSGIAPITTRLFEEAPVWTSRCVSTKIGYEHVFVPEARGDARPCHRPAPARARAQPRPPPGQTAPPTPLDRLPTRPRKDASLAAGAGRRTDRARRPGHAPPARRSPRRPHGRAPAPLRRLLARDPLAHAPTPDRS